MTDRKKPGPKPGHRQRTARLSMRTFPEVVEAQKLIGTEATERAIVRAAAMKTRKAVK